jgi:hypothetical protein
MSRSRSTQRRGPGNAAGLRQAKVPAALKLYDAHWNYPDDLDIVAAKAGTYQAEGNLKEAAALLTGITCRVQFNPSLRR